MDSNAIRVAAEKVVNKYPSPVVRLAGGKACVPVSELAGLDLQGLPRRTFGGKEYVVVKGV